MRLAVVSWLVVAVYLAPCSGATVQPPVNETSFNLCSKCDCVFAYNVIGEDKSVVNISCSGKSIREITDWMEIPQQIDVLDLSDNNLKYAVITPSGAKITVRKLIFRTNNIERLAEPDFYHVLGLQHLDLSYNNIVQIVGRVFIYVKTLKTLDLSGNVLRELPEGLFSSLTDLEDLSLSGNPLHSISATMVSKLPSLLRLDLSNAALSDLNRDAFKGCDSLKVLNLARNNFDTIPTRAFESVDNLDHLILTGNPVTVLDQRSLWFPTGLKEVDLNQMPELTEVGAKTFSRLPYLYRISLRDNRKLHKLDAEAFQDAKALNKIDLSRNRLETVDNSVKLALICTDSEIDLSNNPWRCDCHLSWMIMCAARFNNSETTCSEPESMKGFQIGLVQEEQMTCDEDLWLAGIGKIDKRLGLAILCLGVIGIVACACATIVLIRYKPRITWNRRVKDPNENLYYVRMQDRDPEKMIPQRY